MHLAEQKVLALRPTTSRPVQYERIPNSESFCNSNVLPFAFERNAERKLPAMWRATKAKMQSRFATKRIELFA